jgi:hypothetical protein
MWAGYFHSVLTMDGSKSLMDGLHGVVRQLSRLQPARPPHAGVEVPRQPLCSDVKKAR